MKRRPRQLVDGRRQPDGRIASIGHTAPLPASGTYRIRLTVLVADIVTALIVGGLGGFILYVLVERF